MVRYLLTLLWICCSTHCAGQVLQGIVSDAATGTPLYPVSVVNRNTGEAVTTAYNGLYSIHAATGDVIAYSYVGYKTELRSQQPSVLLNTINVALEVAENVLNEFTIKRNKWTKYQEDSAERAQTYKLPLQRTHPSPFVSPISALAEKFNKNARRTYEFQKNFAAGEREKFIDTRYTPSLVTKMTGITGDSIGYFMNANPMPFDFARTATDLELRMWIRSNFKAWMAKAKKQ